MDYKHFIQLSISQGVKFDIGKAIKDGFSHFGKSVGSYIGFTIVFFFLAMAASLFASFIPFVGSIAVGVLITPTLLMGYALYARKIQLQENPAFETFFDGFKINYKNLVLVNLIIQMVILALVTFLVLPFLGDMVALFQDPAAFQDPDYLQEIMQEMFMTFLTYWWVFAIYLVVVMVIQVLYVLANYFVIFYGFGFWEAMECSRNLIGKVFFKVVVLYILMGIIMFLAIMVTLGFAILIIFPVMALVNYSLFEQLAGFANDDMELEEDLIID